MKVRHHSKHPGLVARPVESGIRRPSSCKQKLTKKLSESKQHHNVKHWVKTTSECYLPAKSGVLLITDVSPIIGAIFRNY